MSGRAHEDAEGYVYTCAHTHGRAYEDAEGYVYTCAHTHGRVYEDAEGCASVGPLPAAMGSRTSSITH